MADAAENLVPIEQLFDPNSEKYMADPIPQCLALMRRGRVGALSIDVEWAALQVLGQALGRWAGINGRGIERIVTEQVSQLDQLARVVLKIIQGKCVPKRMG